jgi:hypothetical protein
VNPIATYYVFDHLERLREEVARERRTRPVDLRPSRLRRLVVALGGLATHARPEAAPAA